MTTPIIQLTGLPLRRFKPLFSQLEPPELADLHGRYRAHVVGPWWLRITAGPAISLAGLKNWWGKSFDGSEQALNIIRRGSLKYEFLPMDLTVTSSRIDQRPSLCATYPAAASPFPWPHVRDELRQLDEKHLLGLSLLDVAVVRHVPFPFVLQAPLQPFSNKSA